jgi:hypothetical protein
MKIEINALDNTIEIREFTADELKQRELDAKNDELLKAEAEAKQAAKLAILDRIGLTADELQTILG